jgi:anaerobic selenocysteine-containing dehydrogenase
MPADVEAELRAFRETSGAAGNVHSGDYPLRLIVRRIRETSNTSCRHFASARKRRPYNPVGIHPDDLARLGFSNGQDCWLKSPHGRIPTRIKLDPTLKPGVVSMTHGFGGLHGEVEDYLQVGASTSALISLDEDCEPLQAMPRISGVPVALEARG